MGDWADDLAADIVRDLKRGTTDTELIAMRLRILKADAKMAAIKAISLQIEETLGRPETSLGGGDKSTHDDFIDGLRRAGLLLEFSDADWDAYARKHFGPDSPVGLCAPAFGPEPNDPKDMRWREPQRREYRNRHEDPNDYDEGR